MSKKKRLEPRSPSEFLQAKEEFRKTIGGMNFTHPNTWWHIHDAACELRHWMTEERDKARSINKRQKELETLAKCAARLRDSLAGLDSFHAIQINSALMVNYRDFGGDHAPPGIDEFIAGLDALKFTPGLNAPKAAADQLEWLKWMNKPKTVTDELWFKLERRKADSCASSVPSEARQIQNILRPVCLHLAKYEKRPQRLAVIRAVFEAAAHMPADGSDIPKRQSDLFGEWAQTAPGKRAIAAHQDIYKRIAAEK